MMARKTRRIRHSLVRLIAPNLYKRAREFPRPMIEFMKKNFGRNVLVGVEIGVLHGANAESILKVLPIQKLYLIDPYIRYFDGKKWCDPRESLPKAKKKLSKFKEKVVFIIKKSSEAVDDIPNNLDFVYIDGNHAYEFVKKDIEMYYPKVRRGGVIGGHDFSPSFLGVSKAVMDFATKNNLKLHGRKFDWWIVKS